MRLVEQAGSKLAHMLSTSNTYKHPCGREQCNICKDEKAAGDCFKKNII